jgi:hypothetical protein
MLEDLTADLSEVSSVGVDELYKRIVELQVHVTQPQSGLSLSTSRFRNRIAHLRGHLLHLTTLALFPSNVTTSHFQELREQIDCIELNVGSLEMTDQQDHAFSELLNFP